MSKNRDRHRRGPITEPRLRFLWRDLGVQETMLEVWQVIPTLPRPDEIKRRRIASTAKPSNQEM